MTPLHRASYTAVLIATVVLAGCGGDIPGPIPPDEETIRKLTITSIPGIPTQTAAVGYTELGLATPRDGYLYVPRSYDPDVPAPLLVLLHGAEGSSRMWRTTTIEDFAESFGIIIVSTDSRYPTWDLIQTGEYDEDVAFLNQALAFTFDRARIDREQMAIGGFSDGAAEALGIGVANAGLFHKIIAFSPGTMYLPFGRGKPEVFVSHGTNDEVASFPNTRDNIVLTLRSLGLTVEFYGFEGGHEIPPEAMRGAFQWLMDLPIV